MLQGPTCHCSRAKLKAPANLPQVRCIAHWPPVHFLLVISSQLFRTFFLPTPRETRSPLTRQPSDGRISCAVRATMAADGAGVVQRLMGGTGFTHDACLAALDMTCGDEAQAEFMLMRQLSDELAIDEEERCVLALPEHDTSDSSLASGACSGREKTQPRRMRSTSESTRVNPRVRCAHVTDLDDIVAIEGDAFPGEPNYPEVMRAQIGHTDWVVLLVHQADAHMSTKTLGLVDVGARSHPKPLGFLFARITIMEGGHVPCMHLTNFAVAPRHHGRGLGRALLIDFLESVASDQQVFLSVHTQNVVAQSLYTSLGFRPTKKISDYYGPGRHAHVMRAWGLGHSTLTHPLRRAIEIIQSKRGPDNCFHQLQPFGTVRDTRYWPETIVADSFRGSVGQLSHFVPRKAACSWIHDGIVWIDTSDLSECAAATVVSSQAKRLVCVGETDSCDAAAPARLGGLLLSRGSMFTTCHRHALDLHQQPFTPWVCDGCNDKIGTSLADRLRFQCTRGCDYDLCQPCSLRRMQVLVPRGGLTTACCVKPVAGNEDRDIGFICDVCERDIRPEATRLHCVDGCDWDACTSCWPALLRPGKTLPLCH